MSMVAILIKTICAYIVYTLLIGSLVFLDLLSFETFGQLAIQALLVAYIVTIFRPQRPLITLAFIAALALESLIFFSHVSYGLFIALFLLPLSWVLGAWIQTPFLANLGGLLIALFLQQMLLITNQPAASFNFLSLIGHFCINAVFLSIYRIFEKNGKQGNRS